MPSRYLLIEFDDEASATKLMEQINERTRAGKPFRVVGLFAKPTNYCQCHPDLYIERRGRPSITKRGKRFGWWVCTVCKRPTSELNLVNLLKPRDLLATIRWRKRDWQGVERGWSHYFSNLVGMTLADVAEERYNE